METMAMGAKIKAGMARGVASKIIVEF